MQNILLIEVVPVMLLGASLVGWGFLWGIEFAAGQIPVKRWLLRSAHAVVRPLASVTGAIFWRIEAARARLQTALANEEANR